MKPRNIMNMPFEDLARTSAMWLARARALPSEEAFPYLSPLR
jgi:hypothetical protein